MWNPTQNNLKLRFPFFGFKECFSLSLLTASDLHPKITVLVFQWQTQADRYLQGLAGDHSEAKELMETKPELKNKNKE